MLASVGINRHVPSEGGLKHFTESNFVENRGGAEMVEMGADIGASRELSHLTNTPTTCGFTSGIGTSPGGTHTLWPAEFPTVIWAFNCFYEPLVRRDDSLQFRCFVEICKSD